MSHNQLMQLIGPTGLGGLGELLLIYFKVILYVHDCKCYLNWSILQIKKKYIVLKSVILFFVKVLWLVQVWPVCWAVEVLLPAAQPRGTSFEFSMLIPGAVLTHLSDFIYYPPSVRTAPAANQQQPLPPLDRPPASAPPRHPPHPSPLLLPPPARPQ